MLLKEYTEADSIAPCFCLRIVKIVESGTGQRGTTYEFTYPYCVYMEIQTHYLHETRKFVSNVTVLTVNGFRLLPQYSGIIWISLIERREKLEDIRT